MSRTEEADKLARAGLIERLKTIQRDDPLVVGLEWFLRDMERIEIESLCGPRIGDEEAHRGRGRIGALRDVRDQIEQLWQEAHKRDEP